MFGSRGQLYFMVGFVATAIAASAIRPNLASVFMSATIGSIFILVGARGALWPEQARAAIASRQTTTRAREKVERWSITSFRLMWVGFVAAGVYFVWVAAWLISPDHVPEPAHIPSYHFQL